MNSLRRPKGLIWIGSMEIGWVYSSFVDLGRLNIQEASRLLYYRESDWGEVGVWDDGIFRNVAGFTKSDAFL